jgi:hypothetical protein
MQQNSFVIDATVLAKPARKPKHLDSRMKSKPLLTKKEEESLARYEALMTAKRNRLSARSAHVSSVHASQKKKVVLEQSFKMSNLKEMLEQAARNRMEAIEKTKTFHGNHVKKAKQVAKSHHQRLVEDKIKLKKQIEGRLRLSAHRRKQIAHLPRSRLLDPTLWDLDLETRDHSAMRIQNWYRKCKFNPIARVYRKIGLSREKASRLTFQQLVARIQSSVVIKATSFLIIRAKRIAGKSMTFKNPARVLLSAYMLTLYPKETLTTMDAQEEVLFFF